MIYMNTNLPPHGLLYTLPQLQYGYLLDSSACFRLNFFPSIMSPLQITITHLTKNDSYEYIPTPRFHILQTI